MGGFELVMFPIPVLYQDEELVVVDKPVGLMVHRSIISNDRVFLLQILRDQVGKFIYPVHRLDRATSGLILFAFSSETASLLSEAFLKGRIRKKYLAVVRGYISGSGHIDYPLKDLDTGVRQESVTFYRCLTQVELPQAVGRYDTARYTLLEVSPKTGRRHQIRRHFKHVSHPIVGDVRYGDGRHNKFLREKTGVNRMLLHARSLEFRHPDSGIEHNHTAPLPPEMGRVLETFGWMASAGNHKRIPNLVPVDS